MELKNWVDVISDSSELKMIYFFTDWCEECELQRKILMETKLDLPCAAVNADQRPDLAVRYSPQIYPSISILTENNVVGGLFGLNEEAKIVETVTKAKGLMKGEGRLFTPSGRRISRKYDKQEALGLIRRNCLGFFDIYYGGFEKEPKYYLPNVLKFLLTDKDPYSLEVVKYTLDAAIYNLWDDNGGFFAYANTYDWKNPSKVKLADINAEMAMVLLETYKRTKDDYYLTYAVEVAKWMMEMKGKETFYQVSWIDGKGVGGQFLNVNSVVGEMFFMMYQQTKSPEFLEESIRLSEHVRLSHDLMTKSPFFLIDAAHLLRFYASIGKGKEILPEIKEMFYGGNAFYDVTKDHAERERIGRFKLITDNSILAQGLVRLGEIEEAKKIAEFFLDGFQDYAYFSQADYGTLLAMLRENV